MAASTPNGIARPTATTSAKIVSSIVAGKRFKTTSIAEAR